MGHKLSTMQVADWQAFARSEAMLPEFDCDVCSRTGCDACGGVGRLWPASPIAYDSGYEVGGAFPRRPYRGVIAFAHHRRIWLASLRPRDTTPELAAAWLALFPRCQWLPDQFGDVESIPDYMSGLPPPDAARVIAKLEASLIIDMEQAAQQLRRIAELKSQFNL